MFIISTLVGCIGIATLIAEIFIGIAVTGWQGEKPYVRRDEAPGVYWTVIAVHVFLAIFIPALCFAFSLT